MRQILRSYRPYSPLVIGGALAWGAIEALALQRSRRRAARQAAVA